MNLIQIVKVDHAFMLLGRAHYDLTEFRHFRTVHVRRAVVPMVLNNAPEDVHVAALRKGLRHDQRFDPDQVQRVLQVQHLERRVDVDQNEVRTGSSVLRERPLRPVRRVHPDPVAFLQS